MSNIARVAVLLVAATLDIAAARQEPVYDALARAKRNNRRGLIQTGAVGA